MANGSKLRAVLTVNVKENKYQEIKRLECLLNI